LDRPCGELVKLALAQHLLINVTADSVVRLVPPLVMSADEAAQLVAKLSTLIREFLE
jgi:acetylornithine aminotransferase